MDREICVKLNDNTPDRDGYVNSNDNTPDRDGYVKFNDNTADRDGSSGLIKVLELRNDVPSRARTL